MLTALKQKFSGPAAALALGSMAALGTPTAHADDQQYVTPASNASYENVNVPVMDMREGTPHGVSMTAGAATSNQRMVVVYFGDNDEFFETLKDGLRPLMANPNIPLRGIILSDPLEIEYSNGIPLNGREQLIIYANGMLTNIIDNPDINDAEHISNKIHYSHDQMKEVIQLSSLER